MRVINFETCCKAVLQLGLALSRVDVGKARRERRGEFDQEWKAILTFESFWMVKESMDCNLLFKKDVISSVL